MADPGGGAKLQIFGAEDVKDQMLMRLDEIGENWENLGTKVICYSTKEAEQSRVAHAPTLQDRESGSE